MLQVRAEAADRRVGRLVDADEHDLPRRQPAADLHVQERRHRRRGRHADDLIADRLA